MSINIERLKTMDIYNDNSSSNSSQSDKPKVDYDALNKYVVETCGLQNPETMIGTVSKIVDLGVQPQAPASYDVDKEDEGLSKEQLTEKYASEIAEPNNTLLGFEDRWDNQSKGYVLKKIVYQKPQQSIAIAVDFPSIMLDKGKFFGEENSTPKPLRLWLGGTYWDKDLKKMFIQNVTPLKVTKDDKLGWTVPPRSSLYRMAEGAKLMPFGTAFDRANADQLLGKSLQFKIQVYFNKGNNGNLYYTEKISFVGGLSRDQQPKPLENTHLIQLMRDNDLEGVKELRAHVINTLERAENFNGSKLQEQLQAVKNSRSGNTTSAPNTQGNHEVEKPTQPRVEQEVPPPYDEQLPF